ncbi:hypothetical protein ASPCAL05725 [Aspergillus calidoustus]|uniref:Transcription factor domain-containing protein n=1 Tax=Aspergillus calidoustus TaxID=454130 RepID=A0A0U4Z4K7_ASPCI|nr:hypothetical protein ASPCAL05725 [Aspergillus calidoustus]
MSTGNCSMTELLEAIDNSTPDSLFDADAFPDFFGHNAQFSEDDTTPSLGQSTSGISRSSVVPAGAPTSPSIHIYLGSLGEVQPIQSSMPAWQWVINELKSYPREFAQRGEAIFLHRELYRDSLPQAIRAAYGLSSNQCLTSETNQELLFRIIDAEVLELLKPSHNTEILEELARLQAFVFYQTIRFFHGGLGQRSMAEQQQSLVMTMALKLLSRSQTEFGDSEAGNWRTWILAECVRRTAIVVYFLYGINSVFRDGICVGLHTLVKLPLSTTISSWGSESNHSHQGCGTTIPYETFLSHWLASTPRKLDPFEKLLLVPCQGLDTVELYDLAA